MLVSVISPSFIFLIIPSTTKHHFTHLFFTHIIACVFVSTSLQDKKQICLLRAIKEVGSLNLAYFQYLQIYSTNSIYWTPGGVGERGRQCKHYAYAFCCAVSSKVLCL
jgi:hypothetical protein